MADSYNDLDVHLFGLGLGLRTLPIAPRAAAKALLLPVEYIRCAEFRYVLTQLRVARGMTVLDLGSPKMLSLFMAARIGAQVVATDLVDYFIAEYAVYARAALRDGESFAMETQDGQALTYADESFDRVFSVSVIEHIPGEGDTAAMHEIARVLKPGGLASITVPYSEKGYREAFGSEYWTNAPDAFNYRTYDRPTLRSRLLDGPLELVDMSFCGERRIAVEDRIISPRLPRLVKWSMFPFHLPLSRLFVDDLEEDAPSHKKVACLTLRKPDGSASRRR